MGQIVLVLHADDLANLASFRDLRGGHVAQPNMPYQALTLEIGQDVQRRFDRALGRAMPVDNDAKVDDIECVDPEIFQIVVDRLGELFAREGRIP
ncbi:hypothetical protein BwSG20_13130 [Bradyrhizobium ottawaense]|nr:hypothetical protein BwSG20_13130 [Bradyrhizobium ottawaense]